ncbi:MAG: DUF2179 domain-containing protein [Candidatus Caldatribacteriaceae bacterium]
MGGFDWYNFVFLPSIIFASRVADVSLGTMRIILTSRGKRNIAPFLGFAEVLLWIVVVSKLVTRSHTPLAFLGYAAGFALGNFLGIYIEEWFAMGHVIVRVILKRGGEQLFETLKAARCGVTAFDGMGSRGPVKLIFTIVRRKDLQNIINIINTVCPGAFFSVEDVRTAQAGIFPPLHFSERKGK